MYMNRQGKRIDSTKDLPSRVSPFLLIVTRGHVSFLPGPWPFLRAALRRYRLLRDKSRLCMALPHDHIQAHAPWQSRYCCEPWKKTKARNTCVFFLIGDKALPGLNQLHKIPGRNL